METGIVRQERWKARFEKFSNVQFSAFFGWSSTRHDALSKKSKVLDAAQRSSEELIAASIDAVEKCR